MKKLSKGNIITITIVALVVIFVFSRIKIENNNDNTTEAIQTEVKKETEEVVGKTKETNKTEITSAQIIETIDTEESKVDTREIKAEQNAKQFPADSIASFKGNKFKGMNYFYEGEIVKYTEAEAIGNQIEPSYLVKNENDYVMIVTPYIFDELPLGTKIKVYGHLNGYEYELTTNNLESINNKFGLINAYSVEEID